MAQFSFRENSDHGGVVGAEFIFREAKFQPVYLARRRQLAPQCAIACDAAGGRDAVETQAPGGFHGFFHEHIHNRGLHAGAEIANVFRTVEQCGVVANEITDGGFEAAETEIIAGVVDHRPWEIKGFWISFFREAIDFRSGGVGEADEFSGFIETFPGGIIHGGTKQAMFQFTLNMHEHRVAAAHDEGNIGFERGEIGCERPAGDPGRVEVRFVVVNAEKRLAQGERHRLRGSETGHQRMREAGAAGGGDGFQLIDGGARLGEGGGGHGDQIPQVLAGGEFRDDAAIFGVQPDLRGDNG